MDRASAEREAWRRFGDRPATRQALYTSARRREGRQLLSRLAEETGRDAKLAIRRACRSPGHSAFSVALFGLGIALTTSMFSILDHVLFRPLPFVAADRLVSLQSGDRGGPCLATGRTLTEQEISDRAPLAMVSSTFAARAFGTTLLDGELDLDVAGTRLSVIGVIVAPSLLPEDAEVWRPLPPQPGSGGTRNNINFQAIGRLAPGVTIEAARAELDGIAAGIREEDPEAIYSWELGVFPLSDVLTTNARGYLLLLFAASAAVLLIVCANLSSTD